MRFSAAETPGEHSVEVRAAGRCPEIDNRRYLVVNVRQAIRVLCRRRPARGRSGKGIGFCIVQRFARGAMRTNDRRLSRRRARKARSWADVASYDCVMLSNVAQCTASEARLLGNYVRAA